MRSSRTTKETSKFFDTSSTAAPLRRSTRSSVARLAHNGASSNTAGDSADNADSEVTFGSDIEDAVKTTVTRKRKRTATMVQPTLRRAAAASALTTRATKVETTQAETKTEHDSDAEPDAETKQKPRRARKPARRTTDAATGTTTVEPPSDWELMYALVKEMRLTGPAANAAVDTMGCERLAQPGASARDRRFHTLVALMLSSQTKDTVNAEAMARLQAELPPHAPGAPPGLNLENMLAVEPALLNELIGKVGFHNNKTKYIKQAAVILRDQFDSDIPPTIEGLVSLPGVGPKMAHLCMSAENGWNRVEGIGVDVHVHRITNLWGWQQPPTKTPEETRLALQAWLPKDKWKEINWLLVGFGQSVCLPVGRRCGDCELGLRGLCRAAEKKKVIEGRKRRVEMVKKEVKVETEGDGDGDGDGGVLIKKEEESVEVEEKKGVVKDIVVNESPRRGIELSAKIKSEDEVA
ncbi:Endonuclease III [Madurella mycetomatis]|uniref:Endonuclease III homolog n=1 Tax=Madurella mycetomatis TaxID=100816 RepID=A0A175VQG2_9PEZI|nr:Endonuclease III [Madurella mycetomatis]